MDGWSFCGMLVSCSQGVCEILEGGRDVKQVPVFASLVCAKYLGCYHVMF